jgi:hypothetical protein
MDDAEREFRNARAIGCWRRLKNAIMGASMVLVGIAIPAWLMSDDAASGHPNGPWPWLAAIACWLVGPVLLWQAFRRPPPYKARPHSGQRD